MRRKELIKLIAGFRRFRDRYFLQEGSVYQRLADSGQTPKTLIIGCSDSRVDPAILTSASPGEIFSVRNVANLVPPFETAKGYHGVSSAIEFAVVNLKVNNIVVLGHRQCGGIRALMTGQSLGSENSFVAQWMNIAKGAKERVLAQFASEPIEVQCRHCEMESIVESLENLKTFPFVSEAMKARDLTLIGAYFDLEQGEIFELDENSKKFNQIEI